MTEIDGQNEGVIDGENKARNSGQDANGVVEG